MVILPSTIPRKSTLLTEIYCRRIFKCIKFLFVVKLIFSILQFLCDFTSVQCCVNIFLVFNIVYLGSCFRHLEFPEPDLWRNLETCQTKSGHQKVRAICQRHCANKTKTLQHVRSIHVGRRDIPCIYCPELFVTNNQRNKHIYRTHGDHHKLAKILKS